jgi:hypothetical protein
MTQSRQAKQAQREKLGARPNVHLPGMSDPTLFRRET